MTELSPQAQAVLDAFLRAPFDNELSVAAALRVAADQVAPSDGSRRTQEIRADILAIADELEAQ